MPSKPTREQEELIISQAEALNTLIVELVPLLRRHLKGAEVTLTGIGEQLEPFHSDPDLMSALNIDHFNTVIHSLQIDLGRLTSNLETKGSEYGIG